MKKIVFKFLEYLILNVIFLGHLFKIIYKDQGFEWKGSYKYSLPIFITYETKLSLDY